MCFRVRSEGTSVFIRTASTEEAEINHALDLPVDGIVLPNLESAEATRRAPFYTKFERCANWSQRAQTGRNQAVRKSLILQT